jgi:hypothetical protein
MSPKTRGRRRSGDDVEGEEEDPSVFRAHHGGIVHRAGATVDPRVPSKGRRLQNLDQALSGELARSTTALNQRRQPWRGHGILLSHGRLTHAERAA